MAESSHKRLAILGSTGTLGSMVLDVVRTQPDYYSIEALVGWDNAQRLIEQAKEFIPDSVIIVNKSFFNHVQEALKSLPIKVYTGLKSVTDLMEHSGIDLVFNAFKGIASLPATLHAIVHHKDVALANKEIMVVAGHLISKLSRHKQVNILPVDSEHSAIFQCLNGEWYNTIEKVYLTASGGPFRGKGISFLNKVTWQEALKHPRWKMGDKISIDSATLMNKGLEVIEAKWFFGLEASQIDVIIHPESIIHSVVQFVDGSMKAQMGLPDMRMPVSYALSYPTRMKNDFVRFSFEEQSRMTFELPDMKSFSCLALAYEALKLGGNMPCVLNAANEMAVQAFRDGQIKFTQIPIVIEDCMNKTKHTVEPALEELYVTHDETLRMANEEITSLSEKG